MDVDALKDYASFIKDTFLSSKTTVLEIFYNETNVCSLLSKENQDSNINTINTPVYEQRDKKGLGFRGFIKKCDIEHLTLGLECFIKCENLYNIVGWSVSTYNTVTNEYLLLGDSKIDLSSRNQKFSSQIQVSKSIIEAYIQGNPLILKWSVEVMSPSSNTEDRNEAHGSSIDTSIDTLMLNLSNEVFTDDVQNKTELDRVKNEMLHCQSQQYLNEEKLNTLEQHCLNIDERLGQLLERINLQEQRVSREISHYATDSLYLRNSNSNDERNVFDHEANASELKRSSSDTMLYQKPLSRTVHTETLERHTLKEAKPIPRSVSTQTNLDNFSIKPTKLKYNQLYVDPWEVDEEFMSESAQVLELTMLDWESHIAFAENTFDGERRPIELAEQKLKEDEVSLQRLDQAVLSQSHRIEHEATEEMPINVKTLIDINSYTTSYDLSSRRKEPSISTINAPSETLETLESFTTTDDSYHFNSNVLEMFKFLSAILFGLVLAFIWHCIRSFFMVR